jgi:hypothetical protein
LTICRRSIDSGGTGGSGDGGESAASRTSGGRYLALVIALILGTLPLASGRVSAQANGAIVPAGTESVTTFPLRVEPGKRYLVDAAGRPFLLHGDTAWSLIAQLTREDVELYLDDRRGRGFNTILVSLIEHFYASNAPANVYGERPFHGRPFEALASLDDLLPFLTFADYGAPNEAYFAHADWVLRRAAEKGFLVLLTPSYVGCCEDGWHKAMIAERAGPAAPVRQVSRPALS